MMNQPYIKVTKKESLEKNSFSIHTTANNTNANVDKMSQKKTKVNDSSYRQFGNDITIKVKNHVPLNAISPPVFKASSKEKVN